jgi:nicotinamidase/pyrazinamidase
MITTVVAEHDVPAVVPNSRSGRPIPEQVVVRKPTRTALIVVDPNRDFCEGGSLAVPGADLAVGNVAEHIKHLGGRYDLVITTSDWHIDPGAHFSDTPDYINSWPVHCVAGSEGAQLHWALSDVAFDEVVYKGHHAAAYSGFEGVTNSGQTLAEVLNAAGIRWVSICGLATDYCVKATAIDALAEGLGVSLLTSLCAGITPEGTAAAQDWLVTRGVGIVRGTGRVC